MSVFSFVTSLARKALALGVFAFIATFALAQDAPQSTAPQPQSAPSAPQVSTPPLSPMPQAPAPQHNVKPVYSDQNYAKPLSGFPNLIAPYSRRIVPPPNLNNSARTDNVFRDGKIYLSINDAVALGLENNLDVTLQRYNLSIADTDILLTSSGAPNRGVNASVVQGTPGGAIGSTSTGGTGSAATGATGTGAGGTQVGAGGAGAGAAGLVLSTLGAGPTIDNFDPVITGNTIVRDAAAAGKHIVCEKPFALSLADADEMIAACQAAGVTLAIYHNYLYYFEHRLASRLIAEGAIGDVVATEICGLGSRPWLGAERFKPGWRFEAALAGGGVLMDIGVHSFYLTERKPVLTNDDQRSRTRTTTKDDDDWTGDRLPACILNRSRPRRRPRPRSRGVSKRNRFALPADASLTLSQAGLDQ